MSGADGPREVVLLRADDPAARRRLQAGADVVATSWGASLHLGEPPEPAALGTLGALVRRARQAGLLLEELGVEHAEDLLRLQDANRDDYSHDPAMALPPAEAATTARQWADGGRVFGAWLDGRLVAATVVRRAADGHVDTLFTSVLREHRRRGIGKAVKALSVLALAEDGARTFRTGGADDNAASLGANRALGYEVDEHWLTLST